MERIIGRIDRHSGRSHRFGRRQRDINTALCIKIKGRRKGELTQRFSHRCHQDLEDSLLIGKLDLRLGRVDIDIDRFRCDGEIDKERGLVIGSQHPRISRLYSLKEIGMTHIPAVDKEILLRFAGSILRFHHEAANRHQLRVCIHLHKSRSIDVLLGITEHRLDTLFLCSGQQFEEYLVVMHESEGHFRIDQHDVIELR